MAVLKVERKPEVKKLTNLVNDAVLPGVPPAPFASREADFNFLAQEQNEKASSGGGLPSLEKGDSGNSNVTANGHRVSGMETKSDDSHSGDGSDSEEEQPVRRSKMRRKHIAVDSSVSDSSSEEIDLQIVDLCDSSENDSGMDHESYDGNKISEANGDTCSAAPPEAVDLAQSDSSDSSSSSSSNSSSDGDDSGSSSSGEGDFIPFTRPHESASAWPSSRARKRTKHSLPLSASASQVGVGSTFGKNGSRPPQSALPVPSWRQKLSKNIGAAQIRWVRRARAYRLLLVHSMMQKGKLSM